VDELRKRMMQQLVGRDDIVLTEGQEQSLAAFMRFYNSADGRNTLLVTGSAGTGKTFMINIFTNYLRKMGYKVVLLAPTGRAAKVITRRTKRAAFTIHHHIYSVKENSYGDLMFQPRDNKDKSQTVYVVDEASMIGEGEKNGGRQGLLGDLLDYVFSTDEDRKLILVGDPVQLPPVGHSESPALDPQLLTSQMRLNLFHSHLSEVKRQESTSGVLENAVRIRDSFLAEEDDSLPILQMSRDVQVLDTAYDGIGTYLSYFEAGNQERVVFITYSNFRAGQVNKAIRHELHGTEDPLVESELLMVVRNNYAWSDDKLPFIANGEMGTVRSVFPETYEEKYGLKWMDVDIEFQDSRGDGILISCKLVLDLLDDKRPQLDSSTQYAVLQQRRSEYAGLNKTQMTEMLRTDPYVHALQVKYGYAITGHKSQGGQWENVVIGFEPNYGGDLKAYIRWTYTVFTRAEQNVFLMNCPFLES
jgi:exodeoxyribonuclease-5